MDKKKSFLERKSTSIVLSITSLVLIVCLLLVATYSWVNEISVDNVDINDISFNLDTGLDAMWEGSTNNSIDISGFDLREMSSADGKNFFVPTDSFYEKKEKNASDKTTTDELRFRKANAADVYNGVGDKGTNKRFLQFTFSLSTEVAYDTPVYIAGKSSITGTGSQFVRVSIDSHSIDSDKNPVAPKIFSNTVDQTYVGVTNNAVQSINSSGVATTETQTIESLKNYTYSGTVTNQDSESTELFNIKSGETKKVTVTVWLEGASGDFDSSIVNKKDISINIVLTTKRDYTNSLTVIDRTIGNWLHNGDGVSESAKLFVIDAAGTNPNAPLAELDYAALTCGADNKTWTGNIPQRYTRVYIRRYSQIESSTKWDYWGPIEIPGAKELNSSGTEQEKRDGLKLKYNILGDEHEGTKENRTYPTDLNNYSAGMWGNFDDSSFTMLNMFDQTYEDFKDADGKFCYMNNSVSSTEKRNIPYVNMKLTYTYNEKPVTANLRYRMYAKNVTKRLFHANIFKGSTDVEISEAGIVPYALGSGSSAQARIDFGDNWQTNIAPKPYFAVSNDSTYWGTRLIYLQISDSGIRDNSILPADISDSPLYRARFFINDNNYKDVYACGWADNYNYGSGTTEFKWNSTLHDYAVVDPGDYTQVKYQRRSSDGTEEYNVSENMTLSSHKDVRFNIYGVNNDAKRNMYYDGSNWQFDRENVPR